MRLSLTAIAIVMLLACKPREAHRSPPRREDAQVAAPEHDAMTTDANAMHADADEAWREGRLIEARRRYEAILTDTPEDWRARFQLAWLDAAFGRLSVEQARALALDTLSVEAHRRVRTLIATVESRFPKPLPGTEADWDIGTLRVTDGSADGFWWLAKGRSAWDVRLYGLAFACYQEACDRSATWYSDPPRWAQGGLSDADEHLRALSDTH